MTPATKVLRAVFGETWQSYEEVGLKILAHISAHPDWEKFTILPRETEMQIMSEAVEEVFGHPIEYYLTKRRSLEYVETRHIIATILNELTNLTLADIAGYLKVSPSTTFINIKHTRERLSVDKFLLAKYYELKQKFINLHENI